MADFSLVTFTSCQRCNGERFVYGLVSNVTSTTRTIIIAIGDENLNNVGQIEETIDAYSSRSFYINPALPVDYTGDVYCTGWQNDKVQFNKYVQQYFDAEDACKTPSAPTGVKAICRDNGSCKISWQNNTDNDIFTYVVERFKNNVYQASIDTYGDYTSITDSEINDCSSSYSYQVFAIDKCLNDGPYSQRVNAEFECIPDWQCEPGETGYEIDGCGNRQYNPECEAACVPDWQCEPGETGYEIDNCGNRRYNENCLPSGCIPDRECEVDEAGKYTGWIIDQNGCIEPEYNIITCPIGEEPASDVVFYAVILGVGIVGYMLLAKK